MSETERALAAQIARDHNDARTAAGLSELREFSPLANYAGTNGVAMRTTSELRHSKLITLLDDFPENMWAAENSLVMFEPADDAIDLWLDSPAHADNLLAPRATHLWVDVRCGADGRMWVTTQFVERQVAAGDALPVADPSVDQFAPSDLRCPIAVGPFAGADAFVARQYNDFLGRDADAAGLAYWVELLNTRQVTPEDVVLNFLNSAEFAGRIRPHAEAALLVTDALPTVAEVESWLGSTTPVAGADVEDESLAARVDVLMVYVGMLDRSPDAEGFEYWTGLALDGAGLGDLVAGFIGSDEYRNSVTAI